MIDRKIRLNIMLQKSTLERLEQEKPSYQRSEYIDNLIRKDLNMSTTTNAQQGFAVYTRSLDYGQGVQTIYARDGKIISQNIGPAEGHYFSYSGDGNPEFVGQDVRVLRGCGFTRLRNKNRLDEIEMSLSEDA